MLIVELLIVAALIVANGFLAMSELALVSAKKPVLDKANKRRRPSQTTRYAP